MDYVIGEEAIAILSFILMLFRLSGIFLVSIFTSECSRETGRAGEGVNMPTHALVTAKQTILHPVRDVVRARLPAA